MTTSSLLLSIVIGSIAVSAIIDQPATDEASSHMLESVSRLESLPQQLILSEIVSRLDLDVLPSLRSLNRFFHQLIGEVMFKIFLERVLISNQYDSQLSLCIESLYRLNEETTNLR